MTKNRTFFLDSIFQLRNEEKIIIFSDIHPISKEEETQVIELLESNYQNEILELPKDSPIFDSQAAIWAAKLLYHAAQLYLVRSNTNKKIKTYIFNFKNNVTPSAVLSADLSLRFLPFIIEQLRGVDINDPLLPLLENILREFHYSSIGSNVEIKGIDWEKHFENESYLQTYIERIVEKKDINRAKIPFFENKLQQHFGIYKDEIWKEL